MKLILSMLMLLWSIAAIAQKNEEDGNRLWLRIPQNKHASVTCNKQTPMLQIAISELQKTWNGPKVIMKLLKTNDSLAQRQKDAFTIVSKGKKVEVSAYGETGLLYAAYHMLRLQTTNVNFTNLYIHEEPTYDIRILNHWDNLDGTIERGYAGHSLWQWDELPEKLSPRYEAYARANASIGINATVLNNVNASPEMLSSETIRKVQALADIFRPYGIRVYLAVNFSSPMVLGGLTDADPKRPEVAQWWRTKADEIYSLIPDFGGFLVKANSEGLPGPLDYHSSHSDGANVLADALRPHGGNVMWRAFVYNAGDGDRAKQAYQEFKPLDGQFRDNVVIQVKNGPIDFQPREPVHPLFGGMEKTPLMLEFQITQEYLGFSNHLVYLATMWKECLDFDTYCKGEGSTIIRVTDGELFDGSIRAISGVANIGLDTNWCGHHFAQANWYAFGRLAWNPQLTPAQIAAEWLQQTFDEVNLDVWQMMLESHEVAVDYMMPIGLHHIFAWTHHYGPEPWCNIPGARVDWLPPYYHRADTLGIGFDRSTKGSNAVSQYFEPNCSLFDKNCPDKYLLWFHHVGWNDTLSNGKTVWYNLCMHYDRGVKAVRAFQQIWQMQQSSVDARRFKEVEERLKIQAHDAEWWRDACLLYFQEFNHQPIPDEFEQPKSRLEDLKKIKLNMGHHN